MNAPDLGAVTWRKSTRSGPNGNCVEVAHLDNAVAVRDSKNPTGPALMFSPASWAAFLEATRSGSSATDPPIAGSQRSSSRR